MKLHRFGGMNLRWQTEICTTEVKWHPEIIGQSSESMIINSFMQKQIWSHHILSWINMRLWIKKHTSRSCLYIIFPSRSWCSTAENTIRANWQMSGSNNKTIRWIGHKFRNGGIISVSAGITGSGNMQFGSSWAHVEGVKLCNEAASLKSVYTRSKSIVGVPTLSQMTLSDKTLSDMT